MSDRYKNRKKNSAFDSLTSEEIRVDVGRTGMTKVGSRKELHVHYGLYIIV